MVYNIPESRPIMEPVVEAGKEAEQRDNFVPNQKVNWKKRKLVVKPAPVNSTKDETRADIEAILDNLKRLERDELPVSDMDAEKVKNLLGNLFMEQLFPHNDKDTFMELLPGKQTSFFDKKA